MGGDITTLAKLTINIIMIREENGYRVLEYTQYAVHIISDLNMHKPVLSSLPLSTHLFLLEEISPFYHFQLIYFLCSLDSAFHVVLLASYKKQISNNVE